MPASNSLFKMNFNSGRETYGAKSNNNNNTTYNNPVRKVGLDFNTTMIGRIKNAPAGCGACGK